MFVRSATQDTSLKIKMSAHRCSGKAHTRKRDQRLCFEYLWVMKRVKTFNFILDGIISSTYFCSITARFRYNFPVGTETMRSIFIGIPRKLEIFTQRGLGSVTSKLKFT